MKEESLALSFEHSMTTEISDIVGQYAEIGLDAMIEDGIFKDIPIVSTVTALYRLGSNIRDKYAAVKLVAFLNEFSKGILDEEKRKEYQAKFASNEKFRNQELSYIMILIDRYISLEKPEMLAKLYLAYLDGIIVWEEFTMYAEVIDRFLLLDCEMLVSESNTYIVYRNIGGESVLRLVALGLMAEKPNNSRVELDGLGDAVFWGDDIEVLSGKKRIYEKTEFGEKLSAILR